MLITSPGRKVGPRTGLGAVALVAALSTQLILVASAALATPGARLWVSRCAGSTTLYDCATIAYRMS